MPFESRQALPAPFKDCLLRPRPYLTMPFETRQALPAPFKDCLLRPRSYLKMPFETRQALPAPFKGRGQGWGSNHLKHN